MDSDFYYFPCLKFKTHFFIIFEKNCHFRGLDSRKFNVWIEYWVNIDDLFLSQYINIII